MVVVEASQVSRRKAPKFARESWDSVWPECKWLANLHFKEVGDFEIIPQRRPRMAEEKMRKANESGVLKIYTARKDGRIVSYLTWTVDEDFECEGLVIGIQGAWFCLPGNGVTAFRLFKWSLEDLKNNFGVKMVFPHHRLQGRGKDLGKFFERLGGVETKVEYSLWIGDKDA